MFSVKTILGVACALALFGVTTPVAAQDGNVNASFEAWLGIAALIAIVGMLLFVFFTEWHTGRRTERMIEALQKARNDVQFLDRLEALAKGVVPAELLINTLSTFQALVRELEGRAENDAASAVRLLEELKGLIRQITDGLPNAPAYPNLLDDETEASG